MPSNGFCRSGVPHIKNKRNRKNIQIFGPGRRTKKLWKIKVTVIPTVIGALGTIFKCLKMTVSIGYQKKNGNHHDDSIAEIGLNTVKGPVNQMRFAVT